MAAQDKRPLCRPFMQPRPRGFAGRRDQHQPSQHAILTRDHAKTVEGLDASLVPCDQPMGFRERRIDQRSAILWRGAESAADKVGHGKRQLAGLTTYTS